MREGDEDLKLEDEYKHQNVQTLCSIKIKSLEDKIFAKNIKHHFFSMNLKQPKRGPKFTKTNRQPPKSQRYNFVEDTKTQFQVEDTRNRLTRQLCFSRVISAHLSLETEKYEKITEIAVY